MRKWQVLFWIPTNSSLNLSLSFQLVISILISSKPALLRTLPINPKRNYSPFITRKQHFLSFYHSFALYSPYHSRRRTLPADWEYAFCHCKATPIVLQLLQIIFSNFLSHLPNVAKAYSLIDLQPAGKKVSYRNKNETVPNRLVLWCQTWKNSWLRF